MTPAVDNVFVVPNGKDYIIYAPLAGRVLRVNAECLQQVKAYVATGERGSMSDSLYKELEQMRWLEFPPPIPMPADRLYSPTHVMLLLSGRCNLRCQYCYASGGEYDARDMPVEIAQGSIDFAAANARRSRSPLSLGFHGNGEPTMAWKALVAAIDHAERVASEAKIPLHLAISTNGVMPRAHAQFIAEKFRVVTLSFDGPAEIHDRNRPKADGTGSFHDVMRFVEILKERGVQLHVRATITKSMVSSLTEMVEFFAQEAKLFSLHFEPSFSGGRASESADRGAPGIEFADAFAAASDRAKELGAHLRFSGTRIGGPFLSFCGCSEDPFSVTIDGRVTACLEVFDCRQPLSKKFFFGQWDKHQGRFTIDYAKLKNLRSMNVLNRNGCSACFAKWHCSGDCPARYFLDSGEALPESPRCEMIRRMSLHLLKRAVGGGTRG